MSATAALYIDALYVKTLREKFCVAQQQETSQVMKDLYGDLIDQLDVHRPIGSNGKHGQYRCTPTCGCDERNAAYDAEPAPQCYHERVTCTCIDCGASPVAY